MILRSLPKVAMLLLQVLSQTCGGIVGQFTADVAAATTRRVRGAQRMEVGWPQVRGRGEHARLAW